MYGGSVGGRTRKLLLILIIGVTGGLLALPSSAPARAQDATILDAPPMILKRVQPGWNLLGWLGADAGTHVFDAIFEAPESVFTFDAQTKRFARFAPSAPALLNDLETVQAFDGVWIFSEAETVWMQPAPWWERAQDLSPGFNLVVWTGATGVPVSEAVASLGDALASLFLWDAGV